MLVLGVDPGAEGGFAALQDGKVVLAEMLPQRVGHRGKTELHSLVFYEAVKKLRDTMGVDLAVVEDVHAIHGDAIVSLATFMINTGRLLGVIEVLNIPVQRVPPPTWKSKILRDTDKSKKAAIGLVQSKYPYAVLIPEGCRTPKDGIAEAVLIAEYGWRYLMKGVSDAN